MSTGKSSHTRAVNLLYHRDVAALDPSLQLIRISLRQCVVLSIDIPEVFEIPIRIER